MDILIFILVFIFGLLIGSFLNVIIFRLNTGRTMISGRSMCMSCGKNLRWFELIPVFSFLVQGGRCRRCKSRISSQYIIVELITAIIFSIIIFKFLPFIYISSSFYLINSIFYSVIFSILIIISFYDIRHKIIPEKLSFVFILLSFFFIFVNQNPFGPVFIIPSWQAIISGPVLLLPFALIWLLSSGKLMGLGDAKLALGFGWLLGLLEGIFAVIFSFWVGAVVCLIAMLLSKKRRKIGMKTEIPLAPFLIFGTLITFIFNLNVFDLIKIFQF